MQFVCERDGSVRSFLLLLRLLWQLGMGSMVVAATILSATTNSLSANCHWPAGLAASTSIISKTPSTLLLHGQLGMGSEAVAATTPSAAPNLSSAHRHWPVSQQFLHQLVIQTPLGVRSLEEVARFHSPAIELKAAASTDCCTLCSCLYAQPPSSAATSTRSCSCLSSQLPPFAVEATSLHSCLHSQLPPPTAASTRSCSYLHSQLPPFAAASSHS